MATQNKVSATLSAESVSNINAALATIRDNLPFLTPLTKEDRIRLPKAGDSSESFVQESLIFVDQNPDALPGNFNKAEFIKDGALKEQYRQVVSNIQHLLEQVKDTDTALDCDLYIQSLDVYAFAKSNNRNGSYDAYIDAVKARFARRPRSNNPPPTA